MPHHLSGPRSLTEPIAISPNLTVPQPSAPGISPGCARFRSPSHRRRLRRADLSPPAPPSDADTPGDPAQFALEAEDEFVFDCAFSSLRRRRPARPPGRHALDSHGRDDRVQVNKATAARATRFVFAGPRRIRSSLDAPSMLKTIATGQLASTDPGSIFLDGKNHLSLVVEVDCPAVLGGGELFGVVAETLARSKLAVRFERAGRPRRRT